VHPVGIFLYPRHNTLEVYVKAEMLASIPLFFAVTTTFAIPALLLWGWVRWAKDKTENPRSRSTTFSLLGFSLATASAALAIATHLYARFVHNFPLYDPALMKIYACGCLLSIAGIAFAVAGSGKPNPIRWLAPVCAFGTLIFWLMAMSTE
jgi:hypothetical protein